jgi:aryl-alcohol dehydrogenase-like predicted oxidoreductase
MTRERIAEMPDDDWRKRDWNFQEPLLSRNLRLVETLRSVGQRHKASPGEVAIAWTLKNPTVTAAIVGVRNAQQAKGNVGGASIELTSDEVAELGGSCCALGCPQKPNDRAQTQPGTANRKKE